MRIERRRRRCFWWRWKEGYTGGRGDKQNAIAFTVDAHKLVRMGSPAFQPDSRYIKPTARGRNRENSRKACVLSKSQQTAVWTWFFLQSYSNQRDYEYFSLVFYIILSKWSQNQESYHEFWPFFSSLLLVLYWFKIKSNLNYFYEFGSKIVFKNLFKIVQYSFIFTYIVNGLYTTGF